MKEVLFLNISTPSLTHSASEYFKKLALKRSKTPNFKRLRTSQRLGQSQGQNCNFLKVNSIFFKTALFIARSMHVGTR